MESKQKTSPAPQTNDNDVDLGQLFSKTGNVITDFFSWLGNIFSGLGTALLLLLFFIRRNLLWLLIGAVVGLGYGYYLVSIHGDNYRSSITMRTNFNSARSLYGTVDFLNALISNGQSKELASILKVSEADARSLKDFYGSPVVSELITAEMYKTNFLDQKYNVRLRTDTFWTKTINYNEFKGNLTRFDYPLHEIQVVSNSASVFPKIQKGLVEYISANDLLQQVKQTGDTINIQEVQILESSIESLDTLRRAYAKRLSAASSSGSQGNNVTLFDAPSPLRNPELDLYDKILQLKDELRSAKNKAVMEKSIVQIYTPFGHIGKKVGFLEQYVVRYTLLGLAVAFIITAAIALYKLLVQLEKKHKSTGNAVRV